MPKGYWIARVDVHDPEGYKTYLAANGVAFAKYRARFLVRGGPFETPAGESRTRNIVLEFEDYAAALACYRSPEYQAAIPPRDKSATVDLVIIEGYDGPQPGDA
jgi:uncharacterized protein (DUF1330 family)